MLKQELYPRVIGTGQTFEEAVKEFMDHLTAFIKARMNGNLAEFVEKDNAGQAGKPRNPESTASVKRVPVKQTHLHSIESNQYTARSIDGV
jgi:hypothetical protein